MENVQIDGLVKQRQELEKLMMSNPATEKRVQGLIRKVLLEARKQISNQAKYDIHSDPRNAYKAVKTAVYKRILGGSVSILNKRRAGATSLYEPPRTLQQGQRGGNRRLRSQRTEQLMSYQGADRGFILRFLNAGTQNRVIEFTSDPHRSKVNRGSQGGDVRKYGLTTNTGARGRIAPRNFFANSSQTAMMKAAEQLGTLIDEMIKNEIR